MTVYEVRYRGRMDFDRRYLVEADDEDHADEQGFDKLQHDLDASAREINVLDFNVSVAKKEEVEG